MDGCFYYFIEYDWSTDMLQPFWSSDDFVTGYNHSITYQTQNLKILLINFLALLPYAMHLIIFLSTVPKNIFHYFLAYKKIKLLGKLIQN